MYKVNQNMWENVERFDTMKPNSNILDTGENSYIDRELG